MAVTTKQLAIALYNALDQAPSPDVAPIIQSFIQVLHERHMISKAERVIDDFRLYANSIAGIEAVTAETVHPLSERELSELTTKLKNALGKTIALTQQTNPALLGGVRLRVGDTIIDGSLAGRLEQLRVQTSSVI